MPSVSSRIWTLVTVSISYNDNHYTTGTPRSYGLKETVTTMMMFYKNRKAMVHSPNGAINFVIIVGILLGDT